MYRHAIAAFTATSAVLLAPAGTANAEEIAPAAAVDCSNRDGYSFNMSPPPPMSGEVNAEDVQGLMKSVLAGSSLDNIVSPRLDSPVASAAWVAYAAPSPSPSLPPFPSPSLPPIPSPSLPVPAPSGSVAPAPSGAVAPAPSGAVAPAPAAYRLSPADGSLEDLINRALECARRTTPQGATLPNRPFVDTAPVAYYIEKLAATTPGVCVPAYTPPRPAQNPPSLMESLGITRLLDSVIVNPAECTPPMPANRPASLMDAIGVTGLVNQFANDD